MYVTTRQKKKMILNLGGILLIILLVVGGIFLFMNIFDREETSSPPQDVFVSNLSPDSVSISWVAEEEVEGYAKVYEGDEEIGEFQSVWDESSRVHYVNVDGLQPDTKYDFKIFSGDQMYEKSSESDFSFETTQDFESNFPSTVVSGDLSDEVSRGFVFLVIEDFAKEPISTYISDGGRWDMDVSKLESVVFDEIDDFDVANIHNIQLLLYTPEGSQIMGGEWSELFDENNVLQKEVSLDMNVNIFGRLMDSEIMGETLEPEQQEGVEEEWDEYYHSSEEEVEDETEVEWRPLVNTDKLYDYGVY